MHTEDLGAPPNKKMAGHFFGGTDTRLLNDTDCPRARPVGPMTHRPLCLVPGVGQAAHRVTAGQKPHPATQGQGPFSWSHSLCGAGHHGATRLEDDLSNSWRPSHEDTRHFSLSQGGIGAAPRAAWPEGCLPLCSVVSDPEGPQKNTQQAGS